MDFLLTRLSKDKTRVYNDQIQVKQKELQPWTAKIDAKQAEIDVRESERETLVQRAADRKASLDEAEKSLEDLEEVHQRQISEQGGFKAKKDQLKRDIAGATQRFEVGLPVSVLCATGLRLVCDFRTLKSVSTREGLRLPRSAIGLKKLGRARRPTGRREPWSTNFNL